MRTAILTTTVFLAIASGWTILAPVGSADVFTNVTEVTTDGYQLLYTLPIPNAGNFRNAKPVPYSVNNRASITQPVDRVAYYVELDTGSGAEWVYVSMDAFTSDLRKYGLPHNRDNPVVHQRIVNNMNVFRSAGSGVSTPSGSTGLATGNIEMWPSGFSGSNAVGIPNASSGASRDFGDSLGSAAAGYGSFQAHNHDLDGSGAGTAGETLFAYNRFSTTGTSDLGLGTNSGADDLDWTFSGNANTYTVKNLQVLVRPGQIPTLDAPAQIATNAPEAAGFDLVYELEIGNTSDFDSTPSIYQVDNAAAHLPGSFKRVGYYMELDGPAGPQFAWVSMNPFTADADKIGVPTFRSGAVFQQIVDNMSVTSNVAGVANVTGSSTGNIEFWPHDYSAGAALGGIGGSGTALDFNDTRSGNGSHGSMQVHNHDPAGAHTVFAMNHWNANGPAELGIGNDPNTGRVNYQPDWTFASNAASYTVKNLYVLVEPTTVESTNNQNDTNTTAFDSEISKYDLGNANQMNLTSVVSSQNPSSGTFPLTKINDGTVGAANTGTYWNENRLPTTVTYEFDTSSKILGYDITEIDSFAGFPGNGSTQANQGFELRVRKVGSDVFESLGSFFNVPYDATDTNANASTKIQLTDPSGMIASGVDAVQLVLIDHGYQVHATNAGTVYREIDVFGTPTGNVVQNGSFESPANTSTTFYSTGDTALGAWEIDGEISLIGDSWGGASDGKQWLSLESNDVSSPNNVGSVSQTLDTVPAGWYLLSFDYAALDPDPARTWTLAYEVGGIEHELEIPGTSGATLTPWQTETFLFEATGPTVLSFLGETQMNGYWGPAIDNVGVFLVGVPEPNTLLLAALGGALFLVFRSRRIVRRR